MREVDLVKSAKLIQEEYHNQKYAGNYCEEMEEGTPPIRRTTRSQILELDRLAKNIPSPNNNELYVSGRNATLRASFACVDQEDHMDNFKEKDSSILLNVPSKKTKSKADLDNQIGKKDITAFVAEIIDRHIPCILIAPAQPTVKLTIFYHANAEDIGQAYEFCKSLNQKLDVSQTDADVLPSRRISRLRHLPRLSRGRGDLERPRTDLVVRYQSDELPAQRHPRDGQVYRIWTSLSLRHYVRVRSSRTHLSVHLHQSSRRTQLRKHRCETAVPEVRQPLEDRQDQVSVSLHPRQRRHPHPLPALEGSLQ